MSDIPYSIVPPEGIPGWHPNIDRLWRYLRRIAPDGKPPSRHKFDPIDIPDLLSRIWILDVTHEPFELVYRMCGTHEVASLECDPTGQSFIGMHRDRLAREPNMLERYRRMARTGEATWRRGNLVFRHQERHKSVENIMVPMTNEGPEVAMILCYSLVFRSDGTLY